MIQFIILIINIIIKIVYYNSLNKNGIIKNWNWKRIKIS